MIVSWNWLKDYVALDMPVDELEYRLMMAGLNHEGTEKVGEDIAIDLEVTSNRPDCLGHIGVAREIAVLYDRELSKPTAAPAESKISVEKLAKVSITCPQLCSRYTARVISGVRVGPSPDWLVRRLASLGIAAINNVVDITNYVLMECGQPLHAFDMANVRGGEIIVREAQLGEEFLAINHKTYKLETGMCVIADAERPVAMGGVMGGADSEVCDGTTDLLIESALFDPISIRTTARKLVLHSDSSYRFERGPDPAGIDWASRRCCELILDLAGGELATGALDAGQPPTEREPIALRLDQIARVLGVKVEPQEVGRILSDLGNQLGETDGSLMHVTPPSWRNDLSREIDLIEEVARIHGYDEIPEDVQVPMAASSRSDEDRVLHRVRHALTAAGYDEAMTASVVDDNSSEAFSPWADAEPLATEIPLLRGATRLRRSLVPSLLAARRHNETLANPRIELFEIANVYLPEAGGRLPAEEKMLAITSGEDYFHVKGTIELLLSAINAPIDLQISQADAGLLAKGRSAELKLDGELLGYIGEVGDAGLKRYDLRSNATIAEIKLATILHHACLVPEYAPTSHFPAVERDLNFEVDESISWSQMEKTVKESAGEYLEAIRFLETYRDEKRLGRGRKSLVLKTVFRKPDGTLTGDEADDARDRIVTVCQESLGAVLRM